MYITIRLLSLSISEYVIVIDNHDFDKAEEGQRYKPVGDLMIFGTALISGATMMISRRKEK